MRVRKIGVLYSPEKFSERPNWMHSFAQAPNILLLKDRIRLFLCCRPAPDKDGMYISRVGYIDLDLTDPMKVLAFSSKPVIELGQRGMFDEFGTYPVSVERSTDGKIVAAYGGWTRCTSVPFDVSIGIAVSDNEGMDFKKIGVGPVLTKNLTDPFVVTSPKLKFFHDKWYLFYTCGTKWIVDESGRPEIIYVLKVATSYDLQNWDRTGNEIIRKRLGEDEAQACPDVIKLDDQFHMFYCYRKALDFRSNTEGSYRIGHAISNDLEKWENTALLDDFLPSETGFDSEMVAYPTVFQSGGKTYMIYAGNGNGRSGIGLAEIEI